MVPDLSPVFVTDKAYTVLKLAVTETLELITKLQTDIVSPLHAPPVQLINSELAPGLAVKLILTPGAKVAEQLEAQVIPFPDTAPEPETTTLRLIAGASNSSTLTSSMMATPPPPKLVLSNTI